MRPARDIGQKLPVLNDGNAKAESEKLRARERSLIAATVMAARWR
jgi:hypothetical protein